MTRMNLVAIAALAGACFGLQPAQAYEAPLVRNNSERHRQRVLGLPV